MPLVPGFREIRGDELVSYLIHASGQDAAEAVNPMPILEMMGLHHLSIDFRSELPEAIVSGADCPRALISFPDRIIATAHDLSEKRARFSTFHEIGHYVLPRHVEELVLCTDSDMSYQAQRQREQEANAFAASLLFHGERFQSEANTHPINARTIKELGDKYKASYEATARRLVETSLRPCMLIIYAKTKNDRNIDLTHVPSWGVQYTIASPAFAIRFFDDVLADSGDPFVTEVLRKTTDVAESITTEVILELPGHVHGRFHAEYFHNYYKVFCLLTSLREDG